MDIFIDTANINEIREAISWGVIDGVTTNPSKIAEENRPFEDIIEDIVKIVDGPISVEAVSLNSDEIIVEARKLAGISDKIVVKVPVIKEGLKAVKTLNKEDIKTNVTLVFSVNQALLAAKAGATYVSPFVGRLDNVGQEGIQMVRDILQVYNNYGFKTRVITAAIRTPIHVLEAAKTGSHVATASFDILTKLFNHSLTDTGLEAFLTDWKKVKGGW
jgi:transaldolase